MYTAKDMVLNVLPREISFGHSNLNFYNFVELLAVRILEGSCYYMPVFILISVYGNDCLDGFSISKVHITK